MLFSRYGFLFGFLPVVVIAFHLLRRWSWDAAMAEWLASQITP